jgi:hypothetical protein
MRWFFNAGGRVRIVPARTGNGNTGGGANAKDNAWTTMYAAVGNFDIGAHTSTRSGTGETLTTDGSALGFHDLDTTGDQVLIKLTDLTAPYTANTFEVKAKLDAAVGTAVTMTVTVISTDGAADTTYDPNNQPGVDVTVDRNGIHTHTLYTLNPNTTEGLSSVYAPSSTGATPTVV